MIPTSPGRVFRADGPLPASGGVLRVATRGSKLAVTQTLTVANVIAESTGLDVAVIVVRTQGDASAAPLAQLGGTGVFVSALREALLAGECDFAVHSLKDLPTGPCTGIALGAIPPRADARDALCAGPGTTLATLPLGARVGTGSPRRAAQVLSRRPDLRVLDLRGNVDTRLARVGVDLDAVILAAAGLDRIGRSDAISERFDLADAPTAAGQGALAVEVREEGLRDARIARALSALDHAPSRAAALAERSMLAALEAGCAAPVGATAKAEAEAEAEAEADRLTLRAVVYRLDGSTSIAAAASAALRPDAHDVLGRRVADELLARGAAELAPLGGPR